MPPEPELLLLCSTSSCLFFIASASFKGGLITDFHWSLLEILEKKKKKICKSPFDLSPEKQGCEMSICWTIDLCLFLNTLQP